MPQADDNTMSVVGGVGGDRYNVCIAGGGGGWQEEGAEREAEAEEGGTPERGGGIKQAINASFSMFEG